ncbi:unnamed protein product [Phytomonas sp. Hart1]|nr:unnamed protein product [Phytomonas sp. Hart1]|eukprot:CCW66315.1 unnamed protein product [Phytomonas sp. isolate Hart1]
MLRGAIHANVFRVVAFLTLGTLSLPCRPSNLFLSRATFSSTSLQRTASLALSGDCPEKRDPARQDGVNVEQEEFAARFFARPLPERLAAITVARFTTATTKKKNGSEPEGMPLVLFLSQIPHLTQETILHDSGEAVRWIQHTALLEVVFGDTSPAAPEDPAALCGDNSSPLVRVCNREALDVLKAIDNLDSAQHATDPYASGKSMQTAREENAEKLQVTSQERHQTILMTLNAVLHCEHDRTKQRYCFINDAYRCVMRSASAETSTSMNENPHSATLRHIASSLQYDDFESLVLQDEVFRTQFWVYQDRLITWRDPEELLAPRFEIPISEQSKACQENNYCGWNAPINVPTREDVAEILKYIPVNWGNLGNLGIPPGIKKSRIRLSSSLMWFRRQPYYFEVRDMAGTIEIRRSVLLHPEAHGMTPEEAREQVSLAIATRKANNLIPLGADGYPLQEDLSTVDKAIWKFFYRVSPPYFVPLSLIMQRYTKKNLTEEILLDMAKRFKDDFEVYEVRYVGLPLVRKKRVGIDSSRWRKGFVEDLERYPEDVKGIIVIMKRMCAIWDRPEYVYVRLNSKEQQCVGGYSGMMQILQRHPEIFRVGNRFVCRVDSSDPFTKVEEEPSVTDMTSRTYLRDENPYLSPLDNAKVFHYAMPPDKPCSLDFFLQCASPAMRVALPSRIVTIIQQFPRLFACREMSPGVYSVHKINAPTTNSPCRVNEQKVLHGSLCEGYIADRNTKQTDDQITRKTSSGDSPCDDNNVKEEDSSWLLESEIAAEADLSRTVVIDAVKDLIPPNGVESANLLFWASMSVQRAANHHYGGLIKMVESEKKHFRVVDSADSKMIYCA